MDILETIARIVTLRSEKNVYLVTRIHRNSLQHSLLSHVRLKDTTSRRAPAKSFGI